MNEKYDELVNKVLRVGIRCKARGLEARELLAQTITLDPQDDVITLNGFETNLEYAREELAWYLSGSRNISFSPRIKRIWSKYSDDGITARSAYGFKIFSELCDEPRVSQWRWVIDELRRDLDSRRALINVNSIEDKKHDSKDIPCTIALHYLIRDEKLVAITYMRSNDLFYGFRNDVYCFCELQKLLAKELGIDASFYHHVVSSLHLYESTISSLKEKGFIKENN